MNKIFPYLLMLGLGWSVFSCVSDDDIDFPEEDNQERPQVSVAAATYLHSLVGPSRTDKQCFEFVFPLEMGFDNGITVTAESEDGLLEIARSQSSGLQVNAIVFPFLVVIDGTLDNIENEKEFVELLVRCGIPTFRDEFFELIEHCFTLDYPLVLVSEDSVPFTVNNLDELFDFTDNQGELYQPVFEFPVAGTVLPDSAITFSGYFDFYRVFDRCEICPELTFSIDEEFAIGKYIFEPVFEGEDTVEVYSWWIDGVLVKTDGPGVDGDNLLVETFFPGTYEICIKASTDRCELVEFCEELKVPDRCPELFFTAEQEGDLPLYVFTADFDGMDEIFYDWKIFKGEELIFAETEIPGEGDNKLIEDFAPGHYVICIKAELEGCPEVLEFCIEIVIPDRCPDLFYEFQRQGDTRAYEFVAAFDGKTEIEYTWAIYQNGDLIFFETETVGNADHQLFFQFDPGSYVVCIETETDRCTEVATFCREFLIE